MKAFLCWTIVAFWLEILSTTAHRTEVEEACLHKWQQHRRQKRFILFENSGICKFVGGITFPVNLDDKRFWRQLVLTMNFQYQFPVPSTPIYWWDAPIFDTRALSLDAPNLTYVDQAQSFIYEFAEEFMNRRDMNGRACLQRAICENVQIHRHNGIFAEILNRVLIPHKSLDSRYVRALHMGRHGVDCRAAYPEAQSCWLDRYLHLREDQFKQSFLK